MGARVSILQVRGPTVGWLETTLAAKDAKLHFLE